MAPLNPKEPAGTFEDALQSLVSLSLSRHEQLRTLPTVASSKEIAVASLNGVIPYKVPEVGWGLRGVVDHLLNDIAPALNPGQAGSRYFGFVTGGVLPSAAFADWLVTTMDQNVQVHLPDESISTLVEAETMRMLISLLSLSSSDFTGTFCTGATTSNLLALICAREWVVRHIMERKGRKKWSFAEEGFGGEHVPPVQIFSASPHASIRKAAALAGIGRKNVIDIGRTGAQVFASLEKESSEAAEHEKHLDAFVASTEVDLTHLEERLREARKNKRGAIVVVGFGEVNTGALSSQIPDIAKLCKRFGAWLHIDAAFAGFVGLCSGMEWVKDHFRHANSITADAHKTLNVPYESAFLLIRKDLGVFEDHASELEQVCGTGAGPAPAYLNVARQKSSSVRTYDTDIMLDVDNMPARRSEIERRRQEYIQGLPSPLYRNLENSRRFRALPIYASLLSQGRDGYSEIVTRQIEFARSIEAWMRDEGESGGAKWYEVLTPSRPRSTDIEWGPRVWEQGGAWGSNVVLFRARPQESPFSPPTSPHCSIDLFTHQQTGHTALAAALKDGGRMYVSTTVFAKIPAVRIAVSNWATGLEEDRGDGSALSSAPESDLDIVIGRLKEVMSSQSGED